MCKMRLTSLFCRNFEMIRYHLPLEVNEACPCPSACVQQRCLLLPITASRIIAPSYMHVSFHERLHMRVMQTLPPILSCVISQVFGCHNCQPRAGVKTKPTTINQVNIRNALFTRQTAYGDNNFLANAFFMHGVVYYILHMNTSVAIFMHQPNL